MITSSVQQDHRKYHVFCLLDLSAAFDTIDHDILITGHFLVWYPGLCSQLVQVIPVISLLPFQMWKWLVFLVHILLWCPQGSVLGPLLFIMYTTPLSTLISSCSLNSHLYADGTQLFLYFHPTHFDSSIGHLQSAVDRISSWIATNVLTLNSSLRQNFCS